MVVLFTCPYISPSSVVGKQGKLAIAYFLSSSLLKWALLWAFVELECQDSLFDTKSKMRHGNIIFSVTMSWQIAPYVLPYLQSSTWNL